MSIIYLCPNSNVPTGGIKVIYRHSEILVNNGFQSAIYHPYDPDFRCTWFDNNVNLHKTAVFNAAEDFIVIPEAWAEKFGQQCIDSGLRFAIFVQNGYYINPQLDSNDFTGGVLRNIYLAADLILSISDDATSMIKLAYPNIGHKKILRLLPNIPECFTGEVDWKIKEKLITYMPRKLSNHSALVNFYMMPYLNEGWRIVSIENSTEEKVFSLLSRSSIFLSFCDMEGFGLPPLEAAFSGNIVVGYTGQGAIEYFNNPIFRAVKNGDFKSYIELIKVAIKDTNCEDFNLPGMRNQLNSLRGFYGKGNEIQYLLKFAHKIQNINK